MLVAFSMIISLGLAICSFASSANWFKGIILGRFIFGIAGDSISTAQWSLILFYFAPNEMGLVNVWFLHLSLFQEGLIYLMTSLAEVVNFPLSPQLSKVGGVNLVFYFCMATAVVSLALLLVLLYFDSRLKKTIESVFQLFFSFHSWRTYSTLIQILQKTLISAKQLKKSLGL